MHKYKAVAYIEKNPIKDMSNTITKDEAKGMFADLKTWFNKKMNPVKNASTATNEGTLYYEGDTLAVGTAVFSDEAMTTAAADGTYTNDAQTITVAGGAVTEIEDVQDVADLNAANARIAELEAQLAAANEKATNAENSVTALRTEFENKLTEVMNKVIGDGGNPDNHKQVPPAAEKPMTVSQRMRELAAQNQKKYSKIN